VFPASQPPSPLRSLGIFRKEDEGNVNASRARCGINLFRIGPRRQHSISIEGEPLPGVFRFVFLQPTHFPRSAIRRLVGIYWRLLSSDLTILLFEPLAQAALVFQRQRARGGNHLFQRCVSHGSFS
jgi:hypothetical protein